MTSYYIVTKWPHDDKKRIKQAIISQLLSNFA
jgi:hypothetical protein